MVLGNVNWWSRGELVLGLRGNGPFYLDALEASAEESNRNGPFYLDALEASVEELDGIAR